MRIDQTIAKGFETMRGAGIHQEELFSYLSPESRIPKNHPLRPVQEMVNKALAELSIQFEAVYADTGRPSIAPEKLLRASLLQIFYSIRSERLLCEQLDYNLLFRWFVGLSMDDVAWDHSTFCNTRDRLLESDIARRFFYAVLAKAEDKGLTSDEHFSVGGTLIEAWASMKCVRPKDDSNDPPQVGGRNPERGFHGEKRKNETHRSNTDLETKMFRKGPGKEAKLCYMGHALMENRNGLVVDARLTTAQRNATVPLKCWPSDRVRIESLSVWIDSMTLRALWPIATDNQMVTRQTLFDQMLNKLRMNLVFEITQFHNASFSARFLTAC